MTAFLETPRFPDEISAWAKGGRGKKLDVVETYGGNEFRNSPWTNQRGEWTIDEALRTGNESSSYYIATLTRFARSTQWGLYGFRFKCWEDYRHNDGGGVGGVFVGLGGGTWQMYKSYALSPLTYVQIIQKPVSPIVVTGGSGWSVNYTNGIVTCTGTPTSWTGTYDIPCRFAEDFPSGLGMDSSGALWNWQSLKLIEIRDIA